ncbi:MAG: hypothetical protein ACP5LE_07405 [Thermoplasmata archaeon]
MFGRGRGYRWMYYATGMPGWMRAWQGFYGFGKGYLGYPYGTCRWFPWLPRWWWSGMYGPVTWSSSGPVLSSQVGSREEEIAILENELTAMESEKKGIEEAINATRKRIEELKTQK